MPAAALLFLVALAVSSGEENPTKSITPLKQAHAHNDYLHDRPLLDALDHGFCSVEADIFLVDGELLVAHTRSELSKERTLKKLYLNPLRERVKTKRRPSTPKWPRRHAPHRLQE